MSKLSFDYSKWDRLELSDDEDSFHPNLDNNLNIRVNRITRDRKEEELDEKQKKALAEGNEDEAQKLEAKRPLHVGNLCTVTEERTIIQSNDGSRRDKTKKGEEFSVDEYSMFKEANQKILDEFTEANWEKSHEMCLKHGAILMDDYSNNYFMLSCLDEEMKNNKTKMKKLAHQGQIVSQIFQLAEPMKRPPRDLVPRFFERFDRPESKAAFQEGVDHFIKQIEKRAVDKRKEQEEEETKLAAEAAAAEEEKGEPVSLVEAMYEMSKEDRMGPGGLDPIEVFESLPPELQECFKSGDVEMLKQVSRTMEPGEFEKHFQRCIDSGLWSSG